MVEKANKQKLKKYDISLSSVKKKREDVFPKYWSLLYMFRNFKNSLGSIIGQKRLLMCDDFMIEDYYTSAYTKYLYSHFTYAY